MATAVADLLHECAAAAAVAVEFGDTSTRQRCAVGRHDADCRCSNGGGAAVVVGDPAAVGADGGGCDGDGGAHLADGDVVDCRPTWSLVKCAVLGGATMAELVVDVVVGSGVVG